MNDLVERLRDWASNSTGCNPANAPCAEAADEIERLSTRLAEVERDQGEEFTYFMNAEVDRAPEPLRRLGA